MRVDNRYGALKLFYDGEHNGATYVPVYAYSPYAVFDSPIAIMIIAKRAGSQAIILDEITWLMHQ